MNAPVVELVNAEVRFASGPPWSKRHVHALRGVDLTIDAGKTLGLVGESGSGKSTTGKVCLGLIRLDNGKVLFGGTPFTNRRRELKGALSAVLQNPHWSLNPRLHIGTSVAEPLVINSIGTAQTRRSTVATILERVGLEPTLAKRLPHQLSGGQRQRVAIARALITKPKLIVFDEAVSALDVSVQAQILNLIRELQRETGFAALFISHDLAAVRYIADRVAVMYAGEIVEFASAATFYHRALHPYARGLQEASELLDEPDAKLKEVTVEPPSQGCSLSLRCPLAIDRCRIEIPRLRAIGDDMVACHRASEVSSVA
jgi:oligopeptide/dipeptide ABC transporter ATP-binding protein